MKILASLVLFFSFQASAYVFTQDFSKGFYWQAFPVKVQIVGTDHTGYLSTIADMAIKTWEDSSVVGRNIWDVSAVSSVNTIQWSSNPADFQGLNMATTLAIAVRYNQVPYLIKAQIFINKNHANFSGSSTKLNLYKVLVHELGHTLGLDHNSSITNSIMYPYLNTFLNWGCNMNSYSSCLVNYLDDDDANGGNAAYNGHVQRQTTGFTFALEGESYEEKGLAACGSVAMVGTDNDGDGGNGTMNFLVSLCFGLVLMATLKKVKTFKA